MPTASARILLGLSVLALGAGATAAKTPPVDRLGVVDTLIHQIQGDGLVSPLAGERVTTRGVVTAVVAGGYFLQSLPADEDGDAATSEGLFVYTGTADPMIAAGQRREVEGTVEEARVGASPHQLTLTRLAQTQSLLLGSGVPLPTPVGITLDELSPDADADALERFEGMRVSVAQLVVVGAAGARIDPVAQTAESDGVVHAVWGQTLWLDAEPPFREPGLSLLDAGTPPAGKTLPINDANPEVLRVDSRAQVGAPLLDLGRHDRLRDAVGVLAYEDARYSLLVDPVSSMLVEPRPRGQGPDLVAPGEFRLAWVDLGELYDASDDPGLDEPVLSPANYQARLDRIARSVCRFMLNPQVIAVSGAENLQALRDLSTVIETNPSGNCPQVRQYEALLAEGSESHGLDIGWLVSAESVQDLYRRFQVLDVATFAEAETSPHPAGGAEPLFTTPPSVVRLRLTAGDGSSRLLTVVNLKLHPIAGADSLAPGTNGWPTAGDRIMTLRARQAASLAGWLEARQLADPGEAIAVLGGFDADAFNDGRVDVMGIATGLAAPGNESWVSLPSPLTAPLTNVTLLAAPGIRYNVNDRGDHRALDHILVNQALRDAFTIVPAPPRMNADFPANQRVAAGGIGFSSRDPLMARLWAKASGNADLRAVITSTGTFNPNSANALDLYVANGGPDSVPQVELELRSTLAPGQWSLANDWPGWTCGPTEDHDGGSRAQCRRASLLASELNSFRGDINLDPTLEGTSAVFTASVRGGLDDPDPSNNASTRTFEFNGRADLRVALTPDNGGAEMVPGADGGWVVAIDRTEPNPPGPVEIVIDIDALASEVYLNAFAGSVTCDAGVDTGPRRSRFTCATANYSGLEVARLRVAFSTTPFDGTRVIGLAVAVTSPGGDANPDDNQASGSLRVSDATDLVVSTPTGAPVRPGELGSFYFTVINAMTGVARNARLEILVDLPPSALGVVQNQVSGQTPNIWSCLPPQAHAEGSRITCGVTAPLQQTAFATRTWGFRLYLTPPLDTQAGNGTITARVTVSSDSDELAPADNVAQGSLVVNRDADLEAVAQTDSGAVVEPNVWRFRVGAVVVGGTVPQQPRAHLEFNAPFAPADVQVGYSSGGSADCLPAIPAGGGYAIDCPMRFDTNLELDVRTRPDLAGTTLRLVATVSSERNDPDLGNNVSDASVDVIAEYDLCLGGSCFFPPSVDPHSLVRGENMLAFRFVNRGQSTAQDALATIDIALPASAVAAFVQGQACGPAEATSTTSARIQCALGDIAGLSPEQLLSLRVDSSGVIDDGVDLVIELSASEGETQPWNNRIAKRLAMVPGIDLSANVTAKRASYPDFAEFVLTLGVEGEGVAPASELLVTVDIRAPLPADSVELRSQGWMCGPVTSGMVETHTFFCERLWPVPVGSASWMTVRVPAGQFRQIGSAVGVTATHRFPSLALGTDLVPENNTHSASIIVEGRSTKSTRQAAEPTPAYGGRRWVKPTPLRPGAAPAAMD